MRSTPLLLLACTACRSNLPPNGVLLITIDTWRADHLSEAVTPNAWALSEQGLRFTDAWSPIGLTTAAHASLLTGQLPPRHGLRGNNHHGFTLPQEADTLAERFAAAGWETGAFVSAYPAGPEGGLDQGFRTFSGVASNARTTQATLKEAMPWIEGQTGPWFAWVHAYDPHGPYAPSEQDLAAVGGGEGDRERYAAEVHQVDRLLGPLLKAAGRSDVWVLLTADHGEVLDEETCGWQHDRSASPMVLRVPMVLTGPGIEAGVEHGQVGLVDAWPTLLGLADIDPGVAHEGQDLRTPSERRAWVGESGMCEPACAPGCAPRGVLGKDRVVYGADGGVWTERAGRGGSGESRLRTSLVDYPQPTEDPQDKGAEQVEALGYVDPR